VQLQLGLVKLNYAFRLEPFRFNFLSWTYWVPTPILTDPLADEPNYEEPEWNFCQKGGADADIANGVFNGFISPLECDFGAITAYNANWSTDLSTYCDYNLYRMQWGMGQNFYKGKKLSYSLFPWSCSTDELEEATS
jgi:hypothetical protein